MPRFSSPLVLASAEALVKISAELTERGRDQIKDKNFVFPEEKKYPIHDRQHAESALGFSKMHGSPEVQAKVRAAVEKKYPGLSLEKKAVSQLHLDEIRAGIRIPSDDEEFEAIHGKGSYNPGAYLKHYGKHHTDFVRSAEYKNWLKKQGAAPKKEKRRPWNVANVRSGKRPMSVDTMLRKEKDGSLGVKLGGSRLREAVKFVEEHAPPRQTRFGGMSTGNRHFSMMLGDAPIGHLQVAEYAPGTKGYAAFGQHKVISSGIDPEYRGLGLGSKMYGEVLKQLPEHELASDSVLSDSAARVWDRMGKHRGYQVSKNPTVRSAEPQHQFGLDQYSNATQHVNETLDGYVPAYKAKLDIPEGTKIGAALLKIAQFYGPILPFSDVTDKGAATLAKKNPDHIPPREQVEDQIPKREDGRSFAVTDLAPGTHMSDVGVVNSPQERTASAKFAGALRSFGEFLHHYENPIEVAGLGYLAAPNLDNMQAKFRARRAGAVDASGHIPEEEIEKRRFIKERFHDPVEATGLGILAAPLVAKRALTGSWK